MVTMVTVQIREMVTCDFDDGYCESEMLVAVENEMMVTGWSRIDSFVHNVALPVNAVDVGPHR